MPNNESRENNNAPKDSESASFSLGSLRSTFPGHFRPTSAEFDSMWNTGIFVLDTNVLLNLYRYSPSTRNELLQVLRAVGDRLFLPNQVGREFLDRRLSTIGTQKDKFSKLRIRVKNVRNEMETELLKVLRLHHGESLPEELQKALEEIPASGYQMLDEQLKALESNLPRASSAPEDDEVWAAIEMLVEYRVGPPYEEATLNIIKEEAERRKELVIPPGYKDERPGDYIIWRQTVDEAKRSGSPVVLVTDDRKEDWWSIYNGETIGPRSALVEEIYSEAGVSFHMYTPDRLMREARDRLNVQVSDQSISEAEWASPESEYNFEHQIRRSPSKMDKWLDRHARRRLTDQEKYALRHAALLQESETEIASNLGLSRTELQTVLNRAVSKLHIDSVNSDPEFFIDQSYVPGKAEGAGHRLDHLSRSPTERTREILVRVRGEEGEILEFNRQLQKQFKELEAIQPSFGTDTMYEAYLVLIMSVPIPVARAITMLEVIAEEVGVILEDVSFQ